MASWNLPALANKIAEDIPALKGLIELLLKWDVGDSDTNVPTGAKRLKAVSGGVQIQERGSSAWASIGKLMNNADKVDGFDAIQGVPTAQDKTAIVVRKASGEIPGDIDGNAATATTASGLASGYTVPISKGGTGQTEALAALNALGGRNANNINAGTLATSRGGTGRTDGFVTDVFSTEHSERATLMGQIGSAASKSSVSADSLTLPGLYWCTGCSTAGSSSSRKWPTSQNHFCRVSRYGTTIEQEAWDLSGRVFRRHSSNGGSAWSGWLPAAGSFGDVTIYIASDGSDSYAGLESTDPVKTFARALEMAKALPSAGTVSFRFGSGSWGDVTIDGGEINAGLIAVADRANSLPSTKSYFDSLSGKPSFGTLALSKGKFEISCLTASTVDLSDHCTCTASGWIQFSMMKIADSSFNGGMGETIQYEADNADAAFHIENATLVIQGTLASGTFQSSGDKQYFIQFYGANYVIMEPVYSGTWHVSEKFDAGGICTWAGAKAPQTVPGTEFGWGSGAFVNSGGLTLSGGTGMDANILSVVGANPIREIGIIKALDSGNTDNTYNTPVLIGSQSGSTYVCAGESGPNVPNQLSFDDVLSLDSEHLVLSSDNQIFFITGAGNTAASYQRPLTLNGKWAYGNTPADDNNSTAFATTAWVQRFCGTTKKFLTSHQSLAACVKTSGDQSVNGVKTFSDSLRIGAWIRKNAENSYLRIGGGTETNGSARLLLYGKTYNTSSAGAFTLTAQKNSGDDARNLVGYPSGTLKWNGSNVQVSSDERIKTPLEAVPDEVLDAWEAVQWGQFRYLDAFTEKGKDARLHLGLIAQKVKAVFEDRGLDACRYGILCREVTPDEWTDEEVVDRPAVEKDGKVVLEAVTHTERRLIKGEDLWMVRYAEAQAMEAACLRRKIARLESRIAALEAK